MAVTRRPLNQTMDDGDPGTSQFDPSQLPGYTDPPPEFTVGDDQSTDPSIGTTPIEQQPGLGGGGGIKDFFKNLTLGSGGQGGGLGGLLGNAGFDAALMGLLASLLSPKRSPFKGDLSPQKFLSPLPGLLKGQTDRMGGILNQGIQLPDAFVGQPQGTSIQQSGGVLPFDIGVGMPSLGGSRIPGVGQAGFPSFASSGGGNPPQAGGNQPPISSAPGGGSPPPPPPSSGGAPPLDGGPPPENRSLSGAGGVSRRSPAGPQQGTSPQDAAAAVQLLMTLGKR